MNARRDSSDEPAAGSSGGRALVVGAVVFALAATALLVLTDELRWLRLGIVAALWAALVGAFVAARYRRQVADQREAAADRQKVYELELEREVAARREYELEVAAEAKRRAEEDSRDDIAELRGELQRMRQTLESLLGGEFLVERYALRAESTRMRSLPDDRSLVRKDLKRLAPAVNAEPDLVPPVVREAETELIERIREVHHKPRREPQREVREVREVQRAEPRSQKSQEMRPVRRADRPTPEPVTPKPRPEHPAEVSDRWFVPDGLGDTPPPPSRPKPEPVPQRRTEALPRRAADAQPQRPAEPTPRRAPAAAAWDEGDSEWQPTWEQSGYHQPAPQAPAHDPAVPMGGKSEQTSWLAQFNQTPESPAYGSRGYVPPVVQDKPKPPDPVLTDRPSRRNAEFHDETPPGNRNPQPAETPETGGGRRRRAEGQPSWQESMTRGDQQQSGSHTAGRSVSELLANHGLDSSPRRRRRRED